MHVLGVALMVLSQSCTTAPHEAPLHAERTRRISPEHARGFHWECDQDGLTVLVISQPRTGEVLCTVSVAPNARGDSRGIPGNDVPHVTVDRTKGYVTTSTTHVHLMNAGAGLNGWKGCTSLKYLRSESILAWADSTKVRDVQGDGGWNVEAVEAVAPGWMAVSPAYDLDERSWPLIPLTEYLEPTPMGRAEWMVPLAWLSGDSAAGARAFHQVEAQYLELREATPDIGKRVFTGSVADGVWHAPGNDSFVAQWIRDAGGTYALASTDADENVEMGLETLLKVGAESDAWVVVTYDLDTFTVADLLALDPRHEALLMATDEVWVCNTAHADYFGEVVSHPEWVLEDLKHMMQGDDRGPHGMFERLNVKLTAP